MRIAINRILKLPCPRIFVYFDRVLEGDVGSQPCMVVSYQLLAGRTGKPLGGRVREEVIRCERAAQLGLG